jgi:hypothetical protein
VAQKNNRAVLMLRVINVRGRRRRLFSLFEEFGDVTSFTLGCSETSVCVANLKFKK